MKKRKKMTFRGFVSHERLQLFAGICIFIIEVPLSILCYGDAFSDAPAKGTFLTLTTQTVPISLYSVARP